jgi:hypothetical protein
VIVRIAMKPEVERRVNQLFGPLARATAELAESYSDRELALILDFMKGTRQKLRAHRPVARIGMNPGLTVL